MGYLYYPLVKTKITKLKITVKVKIIRAYSTPCKYTSKTTQIKINILILHHYNYITFFAAYEFYFQAFTLAKKTIQCTSVMLMARQGTYPAQSHKKQSL